jgi:hypothetical protein
VGQFYLLLFSILIDNTSVSMVDGSFVTTAWRVLRLRMEGGPTDTEGSGEYIA